jgi:hypothetical protein
MHNCQPREAKLPWRSRPALAAIATGALSCVVYISTIMALPHKATAPVLRHPFAGNCSPSDTLADAGPPILVFMPACLMYSRRCFLHQNGVPLCSPNQIPLKAFSPNKNSIMFPFSILIKLYFVNPQAVINTLKHYVQYCSSEQRLPAGATHSSHYFTTL